MTKEESVIPKIMKTFSNKKTLPQHSVLSYQIDLYFPEHKLAMAVDKRGHEDRNIDYEIKRQNSIENDLGCEFIRIDPKKKDFDIYVEIGKMYNRRSKSNKRLTEKATKKSFIDKIPKRPLELEFKSNHSIKSKCFKIIVNKILPSV